MAKVKDAQEEPKENKALIIRYKRAPHVRIVGDLVWDESNDWTVTVDDWKLIETLLQQRNGGEDEFEVVGEIAADGVS